MDEHAIQVHVVAWARAHERRWPILGLLFAVPNVGTRHWARERRLRLEGRRAGVPDLMLPVPVHPWAGLALELKRPGGRVSPHQRAWLAALRAVGWCATVAYGADAGILTLRTYCTLWERAT